MNLRCFIGLAVPEELRDRLGAARSAFLNVDPGWTGEKWVTTGNLHVTVAFLGTIPEARVDEMAGQFRNAAEQASSFLLAEPRVLARPSARRARMLWCALADPSGGAAALHTALSGAARGFGVRLEERPFRPHVTLCRARAPRAASQASLSAADAVLRTGPTAMSVVSATLYSSRLTPHGPEYEDLAVWQLRGATHT